MNTFLSTLLGIVIGTILMSLWTWLRRPKPTTQRSPYRTIPTDTNQEYNQQQSRLRGTYNPPAQSTSSSNVPYCPAPPESNNMDHLVQTMLIYNMLNENNRSADPAPTDAPHRSHASFLTPDPSLDTTPPADTGASFDSGSVPDSSPSFDSGSFDSGSSSSDCGSSSFDS